MEVRESELLRPLVGPSVIAVRGPSRSGKTALIERLIQLLSARDLKTAYVKRSHHQLDLPEKASGRVWVQAPSAMVLRTADRLQLTLPPCPEDAADVLAFVPEGIDVVLFETHSPEPYPTILSALFEPTPGEEVIARWRIAGDPEAADLALPAILRTVPQDHDLDRNMRTATRLHGGRGCPGLVLGTRMAMAGTALLGLNTRGHEKRLLTIVETHRCALDGIEAVTGCRGRSLRVLDYGKVAATFYDQHSARAVRLSVRGGLRERVCTDADTATRRLHQYQAYGTWPDEELFQTKWLDNPPALCESPKRRVVCGACGEEVADGRDVSTASGICCRPCAAASVEA